MNYRLKICSEEKAYPLTYLTSDTLPMVGDLIYGGQVINTYQLSDNLYKVVVKKVEVKQKGGIYGWFKVRLFGK